METNCFSSIMPGGGVKWVAKDNQTIPGLQVFSNAQQIRGNFLVQGPKNQNYCGQKTQKEIEMFGI